MRAEQGLSLRVGGCPGLGPVLGEDRLRAVPRPCLDGEPLAPQEVGPDDAGARLTAIAGG